jgi:hypothetical protein
MTSFVLIKCPEELLDYCDVTIKEQLQSICNLKVERVVQNDDSVCAVLKVILRGSRAQKVYG